MRRNDLLFCCVEVADVRFASRLASIAIGKERNGNGRILKDAKHPENYEHEYHDRNQRYGMRPNKYNVGVSQYRQGESRVFCEGCKERDIHVAD
jgi:hypothetical protein